VTHLLDTDHLSILGQQTGREWPVVTAHVNAAGEANVGVSIVSFHEQVRGCHAKLNQARRSADLVKWYEMLFDIQDMFAGMNVVPFDTKAAAELDRLHGLNLRVKEMDLRIAATALSEKLVLVTRNVSDFGKVPGLRTEDWTK
jgi:tRNA(fMet)-specific endonuclease VapC